MPSGSSVDLAAVHESTSRPGWPSLQPPLARENEFGEEQRVGVRELRLAQTGHFPPISAAQSDGYFYGRGNVDMSDHTSLK